MKCKVSGLAFSKPRVRIMPGRIIAAFGDTTGLGKERREGHGGSRNHDH